MENVRRRLKRKYFIDEKYVLEKVAVCRPRCVAYPRNKPVFDVCRNLIKSVCHFKCSPPPPKMAADAETCRSQK
jgi:hypothetical protein